MKKAGILERVAPAVAVAVFASGCGAIVEEAVEQAAERALEEGIEGDGEVNIDLDDLEDGNVTIEVEGADGEEGTIEFDTESGTIEIEGVEGEDATIDFDAGDGEDATVEFESEDGEGSFSLNADLPEDWPSEFPLPDGVEIVASGSFDDGTTTTFNASFEAPDGSFEELRAHFSGFGLPVVQEADDTSDGFRNYTLNAQDDQANLFVLLSDSLTGLVVGQLVIGVTN